MQCPLCRCNWGDKALDILKENTKQWRDAKAKKAAETKPKATPGAAPTENPLPQNDRGFRCTCCKRNLIYEAKYQCAVCEDVAICKLCFSVKFHPAHEFLVRPAPDRDWEPAFRDNPAKENAEYKKIMEELQTRELTPNDYELLLSLEQKQACIQLPKYLA